MIDDDAKIACLIIVALCGLILIAPSININRFSQRFSALGILDLKEKISDYPHDIVIGQEIKLVLYIENQEGNIQYYKIQAKYYGDQGVIETDQPIESPVVGSWETIITNNSNNTIPITLTAHRIGLNQRLVFELYRYDFNQSEFIFDNKRSYIWLNVTQ